MKSKQATWASYRFRHVEKKVLGFQVWGCSKVGLGLSWDRCDFGTGLASKLHHSIAN